MEQRKDSDWTSQLDTSFRRLHRDRVNDDKLNIPNSQMLNTAWEEFKKCNTSITSDDEKGKKGSKSCELAIKWMENPTRYKVENVRQLNSKFDDASA